MTLTRIKLAPLFVLLVLLSAAALHAGQYAVLNNGFRISIERHQAEGSITHLFLPGGGVTQVSTADIARFEADEYVPPPPRKEEPQPAASAPRAGLSDVDLHGLDPELVHSVIKAESGGNPNAVSPKGARGLMQLMPGTARQLNVADAFDPAQNVEGGTRYLRELIDRYERLDLALAAYNAGPQNVDAHGKQVPPYRETRDYVARIINDFNRKKQQAQSN